MFLKVINMPSNYPNTVAEPSNDNSEAGLDLSIHSRNKTLSPPNVLNPSAAPSPFPSPFPLKSMTPYTPSRATGEFLSSLQSEELPMCNTVHNDNLFSPSAFNDEEEDYRDDEISEYPEPKSVGTLLESFGNGNPGSVKSVAMPSPSTWDEGNKKQNIPVSMNSSTVNRQNLRNIRKPKFRILYHPVPSPRTWETDHDYLDSPAATQPAEENHQRTQCDKSSTAHAGNDQRTAGQSTKNALEGVKKILESTDFQRLEVFGPELEHKTNKRKEIESGKSPPEKAIKQNLTNISSELDVKSVRTGPFRFAETSSSLDVNDLINNTTRYTTLINYTNGLITLNQTNNQQQDSKVSVKEKQAEKSAPVVTKKEVPDPPPVKPCRWCQLQFKSLTDFRNHIPSCDPIFLCEECKPETKKFPNKRTLLRHVKLVHPTAYDTIRNIHKLKKCFKREYIESGEIKLQETEGNSSSAQSTDQTSSEMPPPPSPQVSAMAPSPLTPTAIPPPPLPQATTDMPPPPSPQISTDMPPPPSPQISTDMPPPPSPQIFTDMPPPPSPQISTDMPPPSSPQISTDMPPPSSPQTSLDMPPPPSPRSILASPQRSTAIPPSPHRTTAPVTEPRPPSSFHCNKCAKGFNTKMRHDHHSKRCSGKTVTIKEEPDEDDPAPQIISHTIGRLRLLKKAPSKWRRGPKTDSRFEQLKKNWTDLQAEQNKAICVKCGRTNYFEDNVNEHMVKCRGTMNKKKTVQCELCDASFSNKESLHYHMISTSEHHRIL